MHQKHGREHQYGDGWLEQPWRAVAQVNRSDFEGYRYAVVAWLGLVLVAMGAGEVHADDKKIIGWIERVSITTEGLSMDAKVDTGADFSSVHAEAIRYFTRDTTQWVEFTLRDQTNSAHTLRRPLKRMARIKKKTQGHQERPVVVLEICVGDAKFPAQVNLAQRGHFRYPLLLGRNFLRSRFLVDSSAEYLLEPTCHAARAEGQ